MSTILSVQRLSKRFRRVSTHHRVLVRAAQAILRPRRPAEHAVSEEFWALKDVDFEVEEGEVLGIIGGNGAGKSTLLKILSNISKPTFGRVELYGRVASLLEVGTGFHPELTGRENIYLNGSILGMTKAEIRRKFDEIVEFSGIGDFLDMPVKRYSSGMAVRLGFAVAAHLEPEILVIDEVLAVGDAQFQAKCIGKMSEVSQGGRTVLFVSHNMAAVKALCDRCILIKNGQLIRDGDPGEVIGQYLNARTTESQEKQIQRQQGNFEHDIALESIECHGEHGPVLCGSELRIDCKLRIGEPAWNRNVVVAIYIMDTLGDVVASLSNRFTGQLWCPASEHARVRFVVPQCPLFPGNYKLSFATTIDGKLTDDIFAVGECRVLEGDFFGTGKLPGNSTVGGRAKLLVSHCVEFHYNNAR